jgi:tetratricopeptide (TPR) repeat protein
MAEYLATARNAEGKKVTERVDVGSADEAVRVLRERGFDEIVLHTDDVGARYSNQSQVAEVISPREHLWFRRMPAPVASFLLIVSKSYRQSWLFNLAMLALLAYRFSQGMTWDWLDTMLVVVLLSPVIIAIGAQFFRGAADRYKRLIDAVAWGRWEEVLARADAVGGGVAPEEIAFQQAKALAGLGRLDEAIRTVEPFSDGKRIPAWMYWSRLSGVYSTAKRREESKAAMERAVEFAPENTTLLIDKADSEVWLRRNPRLARAAGAGPEPRDQRPAPTFRAGICVGHNDRRRMIIYLTGRDLRRGDGGAPGAT